MALRVDVATGATTLYEEDLRLPGYIPLTLARSYRSSRDAASCFGPGWQSNLELTLEVGRDHLVYRDAAGRESLFAPVQPGVQATHHETGLVLQHHPQAYVLFHSPLLRQVFPKQHGTGGVLRVERIEDTNSNAIRFGYQGGRLVQLVDTMNRHVHFSYTGDRITTIHVATPQGAVPVRAFRYDTGGDLVAVRTAGGGETRYAYQSHLMVAYTNQLGGHHYAQYDEQRRCITLWRSDTSEVRRLAYDDKLQATLVQAGDGLQSIYKHGGTQQVMTWVGPSGKGQSYMYDAHQRLIGLTSEEGTPVIIQRVDPEKRTFFMIQGEERAAILQLDERFLASEVTDGTFGPFKLAYDERGNLVRLTMPNEAVWAFTREGRGGVTQIASPEGRVLRFTRNAESRELVMSDKLGTRFTERYDPFGRLVEREDALGRRQRRQYDAEGLLRVLAFDGGYQAQFSYDPAGHLVSLADNEGHKITFRRDAFGRVLQQTGADGQPIQFHYDREGRLINASRAGQSVHFEYEQGHLRRFSTSEGRTGSYPNGVEGEAGHEYGLAGEVRMANLEDRPVAFFYDAAGQLTSLQRDGHSLAFSYDRDGLLTAVRAGEDEPATLLQYDARGRLTEVQEGAQNRYGFSYDAGDRLVTLQLPAGRQLRFSYDSMDRVEERQLVEADGQAYPQRIRAGVPLFSEVLRAGIGQLAFQEEVAPSKSGVILQQGQYGIALLIPFAGLKLPVWFQGAYRQQGMMSPNALIPDACFRNFSEELHNGTRLNPEALLQQGAGQTGQGIRWFYTEAPRPHDLQCAAVLPGLWFLERVFYDYHYPDRAPWFVPHHRSEWSRSTDATISGLHTASPMKPAAWKRAQADDSYALSTTVLNQR